MRKLVLLLVMVMAYLVFAAPASATPWYQENSADDETGPHIVVVKDQTKYQEAYLAAISEWNALDAYYNDQGKGVRFVRDMNTEKPVELIVKDHYDPDTLFAADMYFHPEPETDTIRMNTYRLDNSSDFYKRGVAVHEFGHSIGAIHHECTDYWQARTIMVGGCQISYDQPESHDWNDWYQRWIVQFQ